MDNLRYGHVIKYARLFEGISQEDVQKILECAGAHVKIYAKDEFILHEGDEITQIGMLLKGDVQLICEDFWGRKTLVTRVRPGDIFAEAFACAGQPMSNVSVVAERESHVMWMDAQRLLSVCPNVCECHNQIVHNLLGEMARKNIEQNDKMALLSRRNTREKILSYLSMEAKKQKSASIVLPFNQRELADYLSLERSGVSTHLNRLRDEGVIDFERRVFVLRKDVKPD